MTKSVARCRHRLQESQSWMISLVLVLMSMKEKVTAMDTYTEVNIETDQLYRYIVLTRTGTMNIQENG